MSDPKPPNPLVSGAPVLQGYLAPSWVIWTDVGSDAHMNFEASAAPVTDQLFAAGWRQTGHYGLGTAQGVPFPSDDYSERILFIRASEWDDSALINPTANEQWTRIWHNTKWNSFKVEFWASADAPAGYVKISDQVLGPAGADYVYVRADLCEPAGALELAWNDHGSGSDDAATVWTWDIANPNPNAGQRPWRVVTGYDTPSWTPYQIFSDAITMVDESQIYLPF